MAYYCYILECRDGSLYTGWSTDPLRRTQQHNRGKGAKYTQQHRPVQLVYTEELPDRSTAMRRESSIKKMSRARKKTLIQKQSKNSCIPT